MYVWIGIYDDMEKVLENKQEITTRVEFNDADVMLDCVAENRAEIYDYMISKCLAFESERYHFMGFEIIAE